jgi:predicted transcriptional regulator of viral defense system
VQKQSVARALAIFREHGGILRTQQALDAGISPRTLYELRDSAMLTTLGRGLYRLADAPELSQPDLVRVALSVPKGVICLISALSFHNLTSQIPHEIYLALPVHSEKPRHSYPPLHLVWLSGAAYSSGIDVHAIDGVPVRIYGREKSVADCFKFRNTLGLDVALEALRQALRQGCSAETLLSYARIDRVEKIMRPYLEAML